MSNPPVWEIDSLQAMPASTAAVWATSSVRQRVADTLRLPVISSLADIDESIKTLIVAGGGSLMDEAKHFRATQRPELRLVLIPSIWGSGAESSPIAVRNRSGVKEIAISETFLPDAVVYWPALLETVSAERSRHACGDVWSHALEAFLSPLANDALRIELSCLMAEMTQLPLRPDPRWFEASARACVIQARASVGLAHGIAHNIEQPLREQYPQHLWGHAKLCAVFLLPVMTLNRDASSKWTDLSRQHDLDSTALWQVMEQLFEPAAYAQALPPLQENWIRILRDPCTRTNGTLVRSKYIEFFQQFERQVMV
jgi:alcohol dehydrogenase class IV